MDDFNGLDEQLLGVSAMTAFQDLFAALGFLTKASKAQHPAKTHRESTCTLATMGSHSAPRRPGSRRSEDRFDELSLIAYRETGRESVVPHPGGVRISGQGSDEGDLRQGGGHGSVVGGLFVAGPIGRTEVVGPHPADDQTDVHPLRRHEHRGGRPLR